MASFYSSLDLVAVRTLGHPSTLCGSVIVHVGRDKISIIWTALTIWTRLKGLSEYVTR
jgi:hypothetical protein